VRHPRLRHVYQYHLDMELDLQLHAK